MNHIKSAMHQVQQLEKKTFEVMRAVGVERYVVQHPHSHVLVHEHCVASILVSRFTRCVSYTVGSISSAPNFVSKRIASTCCNSCG